MSEKYRCISTEVFEQVSQGLYSLKFPYGKHQITTTDAWYRLKIFLLQRPAQTTEVTVFIQVIIAPSCVTVKLEHP